MDHSITGPGRFCSRQCRWTVASPGVPQEGVEATEEAAGGEARAPVGHAPWESAEEKAQDIEDMGRILEDYKSGSVVEEAAEVAAAVCSLTTS